jgi:hypothetical protein
MGFNYMSEVVTRTKDLLHVRVFFTEEWINGEENFTFDSEPFLTMSDEDLHRYLVDLLSR